MCEILAPAGDNNSALAAINSGADAIYLGLKQFSARSSADNFDFAGLKEIADYASLFGVRVHVAMNTLVKQGEQVVIGGNDMYISLCRKHYNDGRLGPDK